MQVRRAECAQTGQQRDDELLKLRITHFGDVSETRQIRIRLNLRQVDVDAVEARGRILHDGGTRAAAVTAAPLLRRFAHIAGTGGRRNVAAPGRRKGPRPLRRRKRRRPLSRRESPSPLRRRETGPGRRRAARKTGPGGLVLRQVRRNAGLGLGDRIIDHRLDLFEDRLLILLGKSADQLIEHELRIRFEVGIRAERLIKTIGIRLGDGAVADQRINEPLNIQRHNKKALLNERLHFLRRIAICYNSAATGFFQIGRLYSPMILIRSRFGRFPSNSP